MSYITGDHTKWAVVDRLRRMLDEKPYHSEYSVTQSYALLTPILCWTLQNIRNEADPVAHRLLGKLKSYCVSAAPWEVQVSPVERIVMVDGTKIRVPAPRNFDQHTVACFLIDLRNAVAHGDTRTVTPFNHDELLLGFNFACTDKRRGWSGEITLLECDLRRVGLSLAQAYCDAISSGKPHKHDSSFKLEAAAIKELAA